MAYVVLDTSIIVHILKDSQTSKKVVEELDLLDGKVTPVISSVTKGELLSFAKQRQWGDKRIELLDKFLQLIVFIDINFTSEDLQTAYANIDAFSKRKITSPKGEFLSGSAITMGKNDLWIAATAHVLKAPLASTDNDFNHLNDIFIQLKHY